MSVKDILKNPKEIFLSLGHRGLLNWIDDETYIKIAYRCRMGKKLNLENPTTFNEKLQRLKLYDRNTLYTQLVDKYEVRKYIAEKIGEEYLIPLLGVWDRFDDIDFEKLPEQFVLKCTHDSGGLVICRDKSKFNKKKARRKINNCLRHNYFWGQREWPYKNIKPRIIAEKYMSEPSINGLIDYKFFCFNGNPEFLYISCGLENHATASISFFSLDGKLLPFKRKDYKGFNTAPAIPKNIENMKVLAKNLAEYINSPFIRVDLYEISGKVYFSELTFTACSGMIPFDPPEYDMKIGNMLDLSSTGK